MTAKRNYTEKKVIWNMSKATFDEYLKCAIRLGDAEPYSDDYHEAMEDLMSLPGYPLEYEMRPGEVLQPRIAETTKSVVH